MTSDMVGLGDSLMFIEFEVILVIIQQVFPERLMCVRHCARPTKG